MPAGCIAAAVPDAPTMAQGVEAWSRLTALLGQRARLDAQIIESLGDVQRSGTIEMIEGLTLDTALAQTQHLPQAERSMLITAAEVLAHMPVTRHLFNKGVLSWGQVRGIVAEARRLNRDERGWLDDQIGASADRLTNYDPDDLIDQVRIRADEVREDRKSTRLNSSHANISYAVFCLKKKNIKNNVVTP